MLLEWEEFSGVSQRGVVRALGEEGREGRRRLGRLAGKSGLSKGERK